MSDSPDARVRAWRAIRAPLERQLAPLGEAAMARLGVQPGDRVLDIGCGIGGTPNALARAVGPSGSVLGLDLLQSAIDLLRSEALDETNVEFMQGDAQTHPFAPPSFDAAFSRFGTMFFDDPVRAFANIGRALAPGGRFAFVTWRALDENEVDHLPLDAAAPHLPAEPVAEAATASHFAFANPAFVEDLLGRAGFVAIDIAPHDQAVSCGDLQSTLDVCSRVGSLGKILREHPGYAATVMPAVARALATRDGPDGPALRAATWIVSARMG